MNPISRMFLALLFFFLLVAMSNVQGVAAEPSTEGWTKTYGGTNDDFAYSVVQTSDGGYAIAGSYGNGGWLVKTDASGNTEWNKTFLGTAYALIQNSDGGYTMAGASLHNDGDFCLVKTNASGYTERNKSYGGTGYYPSDEARALVQTSDGGYAIAGSTGQSGGNQIRLVKTDSLLNAEWDKKYYVYGTYVAYSVIQATDGGYAIAGAVMSGFEDTYDFLVIKTDASGNVNWTKTYGGEKSDYAYSVIQTADGGYAIGGFTWSYAAFPDVLLVKTDANGDMTWNRTYGGTGRDWAYSMVQTADGGYAIAGATDSFGAGSNDFYLVKADANGNMQWNQTYGGTNDDFAYSVVQANDGGYAIAGFTKSFGAGNSDFWLVKTNEFGVASVGPIEDVKPPTIGTAVQEPPSDVAPYQNVTVTVSITDTESGVKNTTLYYSIDNTATWTAIAMGYNSISHLYDATIPGQSEITNVTYKIVAYDNAENMAARAFDHDNAGYHYYTYTVIPEFSSFIILPVLMIATLLTILVYRRKHVDRR